MLCPTFVRYASQKISAWLQYEHWRLCSFGSQRFDRAGPSIRRAAAAWFGLSADWHTKCLKAAGRRRGAFDSAAICGTARLGTQISHISTFAHQHERDRNDQIQARIHLARRLHADAKLARQDPAQGLRRVSDARAIAAVGF